MASIILTDSYAELSNICITNPETLAYLEGLAPEDRVPELTKAMDLGVAVINRVRTTSDLDFVERKLAEMVSQVDRSFNPKYSDSYLAGLISKFSEFEEGLADQLDSHFGEGGHVSHLLDEKLRMDLEGKTPLGQVFSGLRAEIHSLRDALLKQRGQQEMLERTSAKGFVFEDKALERLQEIARPHGDLVEDLSTQAEVSGSKKGDYLYSIAKSQHRIVLDAKCYKRINSLPGMLSYIKSAITNRDAHFGVIVVPEKENLQKQIGEWNVYDNIIITPLEHLETSVKYAKNTLRLQEFKASEVNTGVIKYKLDEIARKIKEFSSVKGKLTKLNNGVVSSITDIQNSLDAIKDDIVKKLTEIDSEVSS